LELEIGQACELPCEQTEEEIGDEEEEGEIVKEWLVAQQAQLVDSFT